jgi:hypothetical protein
MQEQSEQQRRLALLDAQTHTQRHSHRHHSQHPAPTTHQGGVRGKTQSARRMRPRWAPSPGFPNQQPARVTAPAQPGPGSAAALRPNTCCAEGVGPRKIRAEEAPSLLPRLLWWEARPKTLEACGAGACFGVAFSAIRFAPGSGWLLIQNSEPLRAVRAVEMVDIGHTSLVGSCGTAAALDPIPICSATWSVIFVLVFYRPPGALRVWNSAAVLGAFRSPGETPAP